MRKTEHGSWLSCQEVIVFLASSLAFGAAELTRNPWGMDDALDKMSEGTSIFYRACPHEIAKAGYPPGRVAEAGNVYTNARFLRVAAATRSSVVGSPRAEFRRAR